jgi:hypothetical protein
MMNSRSRAQIELNSDNLRQARELLEDGLAKIKSFYDSSGHAEGYDQSNEVRVLTELRAKIVRRLPSDPLDDLRRRLDTALKAERYEDAAHLRDELSRLGAGRQTGDAWSEKRA